MKSITKQQKGFTIVELLIVIVIIGILAAIVTVAYNGITTRAKRAQDIAAVDKIGNAIKLRSADKGSSMQNSGAGWDGNGWYAFTQKGYSGFGPISIQELLINSGYYKPDDKMPFDVDGVYIGLCTDPANPRRVVMVRATTAPEKTNAEQLANSGCNNSDILTMYDRFGFNIMKVY